MAWRSLSIVILLFVAASAKIGPAGESIQNPSNAAFGDVTSNFANGYMLITTAGQFAFPGILYLALSSGSSFEIVDSYPLGGGMVFPTGPSSATYLLPNYTMGIANYNSYSIDISTGKIQMTSQSSYSLGTFLVTFSPLCYTTQHAGVFAVATAQKASDNNYQMLWRYDISTFQWTEIANLTQISMDAANVDNVEVTTWAPTFDESAVVFVFTTTLWNGNWAFKLARFDMYKSQVSMVVTLDPTNKAPMGYLITSFPSSNSGVLISQQMGSPGNALVLVQPYDFDTLNFGNNVGLIGMWDISMSTGVAMMNGNLFITYDDHNQNPTLAQITYTASPLTVDIEATVPVNSDYTPAIDAEYVYVLEGTNNNGTIGWAQTLTRFPYA